MDMLQNIKNSFNFQGSCNPRSMGALQLAYVGDTVYDLYVRTMLVHESSATAHKLHLQSSSYVCAQAQAAAYHKIENILTEEEKAAFHRGRNAHSGTVPKNASVSDYRIATGLETLLGYLYLSGREERITELMKQILNHEEQREESIT